MATFIKKGDKFVLTITDYTEEGLGVGKLQLEDSGPLFPLFIKDTAIGDKVEVLVIKLAKSYGYGRLIRIIEASKDRVDSKCPISSPCGGCQLRHISYEAQLAWKERHVKNVLERIGGVDINRDDIIFENIIGMPIKSDEDSPKRYRNKAQYPVGLVEDDGCKRVITGFYAGRSHSIIESKDCLIEPEINGSILELIRNYIERNKISVYKEEEGQGLVRHVLIRKAFFSGQIMVCLVVNSKKSIRIFDSLADELSKIEGMKSFLINYNPKKTNVILGEKEELIWGESEIIDSIGDISFKISAKSFFQVNPLQTKALYDKALEYADLKGDEKVWDLYCGAGTISLFLAKSASHVYGVEIAPAAIENAVENAKANNIDNVTFVCGKAEDITSKDIFPKADLILVDPPRKGCDSKLLETIEKSGVDRLVYVSCNPSTLARDIKVLMACGFVLKKVCPVDMFPHSGHVETVVLLTKVQN